MSHLTRLECGQMKAHLEHDERMIEICRMVARTDGAMFPATAIANAIAKLTDDPVHRGERAEGSGAASTNTEHLDNLPPSQLKKFNLLLAQLGAMLRRGLRARGAAQERSQTARANIRPEHDDFFKNMAGASFEWAL